MYNANNNSSIAFHAIHLKGVEVHLKVHILLIASHEHDKTSPLLYSFTSSLLPLLLCGSLGPIPAVEVRAPPVDDTSPHKTATQRAGALVSRSTSRFWWS